MSTTTWYIVGGVLTLMFGILVMIFPKILNYLDDAYFGWCGKLAG